MTEIVWRDPEYQSPIEPGIYQYKFSSGYIGLLTFDGKYFLTAGSQPFRMMPGDEWAIFQEPSPGSVVKQILATSRAVSGPRSKYAVLSKAMEEMGELAQEVMIDEGDHYKPKGKDGVIGEAVDVIVCMVDMIYGMDNSITEDQIQEIVAKKLVKWINTLTEK